MPLILGLVLTLAIAGLASWATPAATPQSVNTGQHFLPPYGSARDRFGFDSGTLSGYDVAQLHGGWYSDWGARLDPAHPDQLVYAQLVAFHAGGDPHDPSQVTFTPDKGTIAAIAAAHPGSLWMMGNEPDSLYQGDPVLPDVYAVVYHDLYAYIKGLDPTALFANGGIVQPTPCRLEYLDIVWDTYLGTYGEAMPVDVWNIHAFILREVYGSWGASTPPGVDPSCGIDYAVDDGDDIDIFWGNIVAMRGWMKDKGYQDKPLIVSEYGILWPQWYAPQFTPARVSHFMTQTFDLFLYTKDSEIGYPADDHRLVQAWAWYSLSDDEWYNGFLFHSGSKALSPMGEAYAQYAAALSETVHADLSARLVTARPSFPPTITQGGTAGLLTFTIHFSGSIGNLGKLPASDVLARSEIVLDRIGTVLLGHDAYYTVPARFDGVVVLPPLTTTLDVPGRHEVRLSLDPDGRVDEPREWNNVVTTTLDLRPDLLALDLAYRPTGPIAQSGALLVTATVHNQGDWPSTAVSGTVHLQTVPEGMLLVPRTLSVPPLNAGEHVEVGLTLTWPVPDHDRYELVLELDSANVVDEQREDNNTYTLTVPVAISATLTPSATTVLTSASGAMELIFPTGAVTVPTAIRYVPLWPGDWGTGALKMSNTAFSLTAVLAEQPVALQRAFTLTWRHSDVDLMALDETRLRLFVWEEGWQDAACGPYQRDANQNRLRTAVCHTGRFVFGDRYDLYLPLTSRAGLPATLQGELSPSTHESERPRSPLRLP